MRNKAHWHQGDLRDPRDRSRRDLTQVLRDLGVGYLSECILETANIRRQDVYRSVADFNDRVSHAEMMAVLHLLCELTLSGEMKVEKPLGVWRHIRKEEKAFSILQSVGGGVANAVCLWFGTPPLFFY